jgi:hypothetical protein
MNILSKVPQYWKAILAFAGPAAGIIVISVQADSPGGSAITKAEWVGAIATAVVTASAVAVKGNAPKPAPPADDEAA